MKFTPEIYNNNRNPKKQKQPQLVGGFNPSEKILYSKIGSFLQIGAKIKNVGNHHQKNNHNQQQQKQNDF